MIQIQFAKKIKGILQDDDSILGLAVAGSWLTDELDEWSDLDLIVVTKENLNGDKALMLAYARRFGNLLSGFTGDHVGEKRLLICLYDDPLIHVDLKFLTLHEFRERIENPVLLLDREGVLQKTINETTPVFPMPDFQWIEDRFWPWLHYGMVKIGRGEYFEALDTLSFLRQHVFGPLLHLKNNNLPRGVRKVESSLDKLDLEKLKDTLAANDKQSLLAAFQNALLLYQSLRKDLFKADILFNPAEPVVIRYFKL